MCLKIVVIECGGDSKIKNIPLPLESFRPAKVMMVRDMASNTQAGVNLDAGIKSAGLLET